MLGPSEMAPNQKDYRDRVEQWSSRHVQTLWPMSRAVLWPDAVLDGARGPVVALDPARQRAIEDLRLIIAKPAMFRAMGNMTRSEEGRVGKVWVSTGRSRGSPYQQ